MPKRSDDTTRPTNPSDGMPSMPDVASQRIDKWLWYTRAIKTRSLAARLVDEGHVRINREKIDKPSATIRSGDVVTLSLGGRIRILKMVGAGNRRGPASEAQQLYEDLTPPEPPREARVPAPAARAPGSGRPTKRERRATDRLRDSDPE